MHDDMYVDTKGVENDDFEEALMWYVMNKEPEILKLMQDYMNKMQAEMTAPGARRQTEATTEAEPTTSPVDKEKMQEAKKQENTEEKKQTTKK